MNLNFSGKHVLVTGAAKGIGLSVVTHLLCSGATVIATDIDSQTLEENLASLHESFSETLICQTLDLSRHHELPRRIDDLICQFGPLDHLVNCAGILQTGALIDANIEDVIKIFSVNSFGALSVMQTVGKAMIKQGFGSIVVIGSNAANTPRPNMGAYSASKAALHMLVKNIGIELASHGIRCNIVSPGSTRTDMQKQLWTNTYGEHDVIAGDAASYRLGIPLQKIAEPDDIAKSVLFLLSEAAGHITMHDLRIDGGATLDN
ncbi:2,3-dihydro-2,3-dihydroxybenzoate dehydrogenase [Veronia nyctiphanis]|uniref:2,3-dihydro-2,3-dihydroxybenzoate dehydrogenase n=1 Tax=Veronia nyctiphanis TaxID=1278244 RepID=A0A4Q0YR56_9GAMM|nr:2,3-dihydro-2,3-dihydroxybenzoate dehydrogenase [Veronia nyctiphanis]RXJ73572.1 2,3-dihydro-2,3-dihydroxybenzoate dehydrogenase [Veronia nyctiphanis]